MDEDNGQHQAMLQEEEQMSNHFIELAAINVGKHIEKKGSLSYLSWAWAVDQLLRADPAAKWEYREADGLPYIKFPDGTAMVYCTVTAFGTPRTMQLPIMDHRNKAIANPDAFAVNTTMQRALVKAIALHGLGLYIYAGEDLPLGADEAAPMLAAAAEADLLASLDEAATADDLRERTKKALAVAHEGGDVEAHKRIKARAVELASRFKSNSERAAA